MKAHFRNHDALRVVKTWCNAWATSNRCHDPMQQPCSFGFQDAGDVMTHHMHCPFWMFLVLYRYITYAVNLSPNPKSCTLTGRGVREVGGVGGDGGWGGTGSWRKEILFYSFWFLIY